MELPLYSMVDECYMCKNTCDHSPKGIFEIDLICKNCTNKEWVNKINNHSLRLMMIKEGTIHGVRY